MDTVYLFDVDGTLTPARRAMDDAFHGLFVEFCKKFDVYLITGSDRPKLNEQVPADLHQLVKGIFTCAGCQFWQDQRLVYQRAHTFDVKLINALESFVAESPFEGRFGNHIEQRTGMINVSVPGRNISHEGRLRYYEWDKHYGERRDFLAVLNQKFPNYTAAAGGQISIDVSPLGWTKAQVLEKLKTWHPATNFVFFGDRMDEGGNDRPLADALLSDCSLNQAVTIEGPDITKAILEKLLTQTD